ncbi:predicted protein [Naegleria gruberi]|uniref:Predicted protein n=1 Tax=Naegleria gruberi TaxID=5762 RepID=D2V9L4_NAEGR|nr:uncharacterized protein NAEGRDRAFT_65481 [Naegleria gruberi]EFC46483.1 predicted protein [Naegleria gruberi]|eukprot:XP_002679227.1 predicted protein [Naegleria gruberi strain NEG-M]
MKQVILGFDDSVKIGVANYSVNDTSSTGCTVFFFPNQQSTCVVDVRGGSPGLFHVSDGYLDAICLSGGSLFGLQTIHGVMAGISELRSNPCMWNQIPIVKGAIIYDFKLDSFDKSFKELVFPDIALGRKAFNCVTTNSFPVGLVGAGSGARAGKMSVIYDLTTKDDNLYALPEPSGQGGAFGYYECKGVQVKIGIFSVLNPVGCIFNKKQECVLGHRSQTIKEKRYATEELIDMNSTERKEQTTTSNTTLTVLITNVTISDQLKRQLAKQLHSEMSTFIRPFNTPDDGDTFFFVSTNELSENHFRYIDFTSLASKLLPDAILSIIE